MRNWNLFLIISSATQFKVFSVPMRNWNLCIVLHCRSTDGRFSAYLWGIETSNTGNATEARKLVFSVPMRNWNLAIQATLTQLLCVFSVPMRNWNRVPSGSRTGSLHVFSVPMRNWNPLLEIPVFSFPVCFQRTYEELKRRHAVDSCVGRCAFSAYLWGIETYFNLKTIPGSDGFQRTYEELKPALRYKWTGTPHSFQRTYEELKPNEANITGGTEVEVFSVPMRNWNLSLWLCLPWLQSRFQRTYEELKLTHAEWAAIALWWFSAYLWGIETTVKYYRRPKTIRVFSVPMRNWNYEFSPFHRYPASVFSVPMRNWN